MGVVIEFPSQCVQPISEDEFEAQHVAVLKEAFRANYYGSQTAEGVCQRGGIPE